MKQHHGEILEEAIRASGIPISRVALRVGYTRQHLYNLFQQASLDLNLIIAVGDYIRYDFSDKIKALKKYKDLGASEERYNSEEPKRYYGNYEQKYHELLEEYNRLLKAHNKLLKGKK